MSCPYLERGSIALCRALGKRGMELNAKETEIDCFSGDFSHCSLLFSPAVRPQRNLPRAVLQKKGAGHGISPYGNTIYFPTA